MWNVEHLEISSKLARIFSWLHSCRFWKKKKKDKEMPQNTSSSSNKRRKLEEEEVVH